MYHRCSTYNIMLSIHNHFSYPNSEDQSEFIIIKIFGATPNLFNYKKIIFFIYFNLKILI
jgi:hypothetical protein